MAIHISPSLLAADTVNLGAVVRAVEMAGADSLHIDVMDGHYVANLAFSPKTVADLRVFMPLPLHVHLEVDNPDQCIRLFPEASIIIVQEDTTPNLAATIRQICNCGMQVGVGVNPDRPVESLLPYLEQPDLLLVMAVWPGFGGQPFDAAVPSKAEWARRQRHTRGLRYAIGLDGGVGERTVGSITGAGVDFLIAGSSIFSNLPSSNATAEIGQRMQRLRGETAAER